jgi:hypothetical protein
MPFIIVLYTYCFSYKSYIQSFKFQNYPKYNEYCHRKEKQVQDVVIVTCFPQPYDTRYWIK